MATVLGLRVSHQLPGRLRMEVPELYRNPFLCRRMEKFFGAQSGIREAKANPLTGRFLVVYDEKTRTAEQLQFAVNKILTAIHFSAISGPAEQAEIHSEVVERAARAIGALQDVKRPLTKPTSPSDLRSQLLHVGVTGGLLASLLAKRFLYGRSRLADSPYLFNLAAATTIISGYPILRSGLEQFAKKKRMNHELLISVATIALLAMRENLAGLSILWLLHLSGLFRSITLEYSRGSIRKMVTGKQSYAWIVENGQKRKVSIQQLKPGDMVVVSTGERIPVDGIIHHGMASVNAGTLTGEALPHNKGVGEDVYTGSTVESGRILILTERVGEATAIAQVLRLVEHAERSKAPITSLAEKYAQHLVPLSLGLAALVFFLTRDFSRTLAILIIGCPAAVGLSTQTAMGMALGKAAANGLLVKNTRAFEELAAVDTVLFDKTGTLTLAQSEITEIIALTQTVTEERVLTLAAAAEIGTVHPLARTLTAAAQKRGIILPVSAPREIPGKGVRALVEGVEVLVGSEEFMVDENVDIRRARANALRMQQLGSGTIYVACNGKIIGLIGIHEKIRRESVGTIANLHDQGIEHIGMITGDTQSAASTVAQQLGISASWSSCLPAEKVSIIEELHRRGRRIVMVGDGINDSPALAAANVGIAMAGNGSDAALEAADVVLNGDDPRKVADLIQLSKQSLEVVRQNLIMSIGLNVVGITLGASRLISPITAALIQNLSTLGVVLNSARILKKRNRSKPKSVLDLQRFAAKHLPTTDQQTICRDASGRLVETTAWHTMRLVDFCETHAVHAKQGLLGEDVRKRLAVYGTNTLQKAKRKGFWRVFIDQFKDVMVQVLLGACGVSLLLGQPKDAILTAVIVLANAFLGTVQEKRAEKSMEALQKLAAPTACVMRDGQWQKLSAEVLVPGDVIVLEAGDCVPADCRLIEAANLEVEESSLTGETLPVRKHIHHIEAVAVPLGDRKNMIFMGTSITRGRAKAVVVATGMVTEMGRIAGMIQEEYFEQTPLQKRLEELGKHLVYGCLGVAGLIFVIGIMRGAPLLNMLQTGASLAVAAIPEGLAAIVLIALAMGVQRMTKKNIVVRRMASIETLGCTTVICSDKTGTLTKNEMTVRTIYQDGSWYRFTGEGYTPQGDIMVGGQIIKLEDHPALCQAIRTAMLCNNAVLCKTQVPTAEAPTNKAIARRQIKWNINGDPTEGALLVAGAKAGMWAEALSATHERIREIPFESERRLMSIIAREINCPAMLYSKGAADSIVSRCTRLLQHNGETVLITEAMRNDIFAAHDAMTKDALRVLALAYREASEEDLELDALEENLVFVGLIGMIDPPRPEVFAAVRKCHRAGVKVVMITGDHPNTAAAIAREIGILRGGDCIVTGRELDEMDDLTLLDQVEKISVYARTSPQHKLRIIRALKSKDYIVAMTGDGVNDAPAVKAADIGIAMGRTGSDVTKEAAAMTLTDDNFATIVAAMEEGRSIYNNIRKAIRYLLATNIGEVILMFLAVLVGLPLPLIPIQLLWINLIGDGLPAIALVNDPPAENIMNQPPRSGDESVFSGGLGKKIMSRGLAIGIGTLSIFTWKLMTGGGIMAARTLALASLCIGQFIHLFDCRNERCTGRVGLLSNPFLAASVGVSMIAVAGVIHVPALQTLFQTVALTPLDWAIATGGAALTAVMDGIFERYVLTRQMAFPLPEPVTCEQILR